MKKIERLARDIRRLHELLRSEIVSACENSDTMELAHVEREAGEDTIYAIDRISEERLIDFFEKQIASYASIVLIAEGLAHGSRVLPDGVSAEDAEFRIIMDPIDGTRGLMYQKRSAWILTGVAPNRSDETALRDIEFAIQTEIPLVKQHLSDMIWGFAGRGATAERCNRLTGEVQPLRLSPSEADTISHGFAMISRFFPGAREVLAEIDEEVIRGALGDVQPGKAHCFEDQYASTGGQLYELLSGHDRFVADLRPLMDKILAGRGLSMGICCHPYDICTELLAREMGVIITDPQGHPLHSKLTVDNEVAWVGYANEKIRSEVEPHLLEALRKRDLI